MGRAGITYTEVANAAIRIQAESKTPTVDSVRNAIGSGSKTTITKHLRTWKEGYLLDSEAIPAPLLNSVKTLWVRIKDEAYDLTQREREETIRLQTQVDILEHQNRQQSEEIKRLHQIIDHYKTILEKLI